MKKQLIESQKGEITFRRKLVQQQVEGKNIYEDEFDTMGIQSILAERMNSTLRQMVNLQERNIDLSPYLEIGAERCQRSLVMENDIGAAGAAIDLSYDMLKSGDHYKNVFHKSNVPLRVCCDANNLPFKSGSVPFVFCYETLHHFPDPTPIVEEIHRVLSSGGHFYFDEEPYKIVLHLNLFHGRKIYSKASLQSSTFRRIFDHFFTDRRGNEVEHGIIENDEISIAVWRRALNIFEEKNVTLHSMRIMDSELYKPQNYLKYLFAYLIGGSISGLCRKAGILKRKEIAVKDNLICPSCNENGRESKLDQESHSFSCSECAQTFPIIEGMFQI